MRGTFGAAVIILTVAGATVSACVDRSGTAAPTVSAATGEATAPRSSPATLAGATPRPSRTPLPTSALPTMRPTLAPVTIDGSDPVVAAAIKDGVHAMGALRGYRFQMSVVGRTLQALDQDTLVDVGSEGIVTHTPHDGFDATMGTRFIEAAFDASTGMSMHIVVLDGTGWDLREGRPPEPQPIPEDVLDLLESTYLPVGVGDRVVAPFAAAFEAVGAETHGGIDAIHYRATPAGLDAYATAIGMDGVWGADLWIAADEGYLLAVKIDCVPPPLPTPEPDASPALTATWAHDRGFHVSLELTDANDPTVEILPPSPGS